MAPVSAAVFVFVSVNADLSRGDANYYHFLTDAPWWAVAGRPPCIPCWRCDVRARVERTCEAVPFRRLTTCCAPVSSDPFYVAQGHSSLQK